MFCSRCGSPLTPGTRFCGACGAPTSAPAGASGPLKRPGVITFLAVLQFLGGAVWLLGALGVMAGLAAGGPAAAAAVAAPMAMVLGVCGALQILCGVGLWQLTWYGRTLQIVFAVIGLLAFPVGTVISILLLIYLSKPGAKTLFSGRPAADLSAEELADVAAVSKSSTAMIVLIVVAVVLLLVMFVAIIAAIAVPGLLRARMAGNEAAAIASLRSIVSAEEAYAATCANGGYAIRLEDLAKPPAGSQAAFIMPDLGSAGAEKSGYRMTLERDRAPGVVDVSPAAVTCNGSVNPPASSYFASAEPITPGVTGVRYFATDSSGTIFESTQPIRNPLVPSSSVTPLR